MADKAQKLAQKAKRKEEKRRKERLREKKKLVKSVQNRLDVRLAKQSTAPWQGESAEDRAIFDDAVLSALEGELAEQVTWVRQALAEVCERAPGEAVERLAAIPRRSPLADWRILLRGLVSWHAGDLTQASEAWSRLDRERRPGRIATSLILAHRDDLTERRLNASPVSSSDAEPWLTNCDDSLLQHAKLVRQSYVQRVALRNAAGIKRFRLGVPDATVTPEHITWLRDFTKQYQSIEPALVQSFHEVAIMRAYCAPFGDIFDQCTKTFHGLRHDRGNVLSRSFYYRGGGTEKKAEQYLSQYLKVDLPQNQELSESLRRAIASHVYCILAEAEMSPPDTDNMLSMFFSDGPDEELVEQYFEDAIKAYPANRAAYEAFEAWYRQLLENDDLLKDSQRAIGAQLADVLSRRIKHLPDDIESRLELVDYLLENDRSQEAQSHIEWLSGTRRDNPLADAMAWKWNLQEAMRLSRRKAWLSNASEHLDTAQGIWPQWLSSDWLPYLRAAVQLRGGDTRAFENMPNDQRVASKLTEACMKLGAAQRMSVPASDLKPLRKDVDNLLLGAEGVADSDLLAAASFFWDLHRSRCKYPAYRLHAPRFLNRLRESFDRSPEMVIDHLDDSVVRGALLVMANENCFNDGYYVYLPKWLTTGKLKQHPTVLAITITAACNRKKSWGAEQYQEDGDALRKASLSTADPYYRHLYNDLAERLDRKIREQGQGTGMLQSIIERFGAMGTDDFDEDENENENENDEDLCNCPECRRRRGEIT